jgi:hypothetical protein
LEYTIDNISIAIKQIVEKLINGEEALNLPITKLYKTSIAMNIWKTIDIILRRKDDFELNGLFIS